METKAANNRAAAAELNEICEQAVIEVLETMFFELPVDRSSLEVAVPAGDLAAWAAFSGDSQGEITVVADPWAARRLAASFLGREDERSINEGESRLVLCELTNMVCGNAVSRVKPRARLRIATPEVLSEPPKSGPWIVFPLESGKVAVQLRIDGFGVSDGPQGAQTPTAAGQSGSRGKDVL